jgi:hypothetical protein
MGKDDRWVTGSPGASRESVIGGLDDQDCRRRLYWYLCAGRSTSFVTSMIAYPL